VDNPLGLTDPLSLADELVINVAGLVVTIGNASGERGSVSIFLSLVFGTSGSSADAASVSSVPMGAPSAGDAVEISFCAAKLGLSPSAVTLSTTPAVKMIETNIERTTSVLLCEYAIWVFIVVFL